MAKTNMVEREKRRAKIVKKYAAKRAQLKELIRSPKFTKMQTLAYAVDGPQGKFHSTHITRRNVGDFDVKLEIIYAGICHSDIHQAKNEWGNSKYPMVPGHEVLGKVVEVGAKVTKFKVGDLGGIGCLVDSCRDCKYCKHHEEHFCEKGSSQTYNGFEMDKKTLTYGGYSTHIVTVESFVIQVSNKFTKLEGIAPLFCAGITTYSPLRAHQNQVAPGKKVGVVGLGGLGHMGVKFAVAMGAEVTIFSTSPSKEADAKKLGASKFILTTDEAAMKSIANTYDLILDTVSAKHEIMPFIFALSPKGVFVIVGAPPSPYSVSGMPLLLGNRTIYGSTIGGIKETQEMTDFCAEHNITSDVEVIKMEQVDEAYERTLKSDVKYRFVIDVKSFKQ